MYKKLPLFFLLYFFFFSPRSILAQNVYFYDDFSTNYVDVNWNRPNSGYSLDIYNVPSIGVYGWSIKSIQGKNYLVGEAPNTESRSYIYVKNIGLSDFTHETEVENKGGIDYVIRFRVD